MLEKDFTEVNQVIKYMNKNDVDKISPNFLKLIRDNMDTSYIFNYDESKNVYQQDLSKNARIIISIMYIKYLATEQEKIKYYEKMVDDKKKDEGNRLKENIFKKEIDKELFDDILNAESNSQDKNLNVMVCETKWYHKIINKIKNFFCKRKR